MFPKPALNQFSGSMNALSRIVAPGAARRRPGRILRATIVVCALVAIAAPAGAEVRIVTGRSTLQDTTLFTRAEFDLSLSGDTLDALSNGIPLTFAVEMVLLRSRRWFLDEKIAQWQSFHELSYHALSGRYVVQAAESPEIDSFRTLSEALDAIGDFSTEWDTQGALPLGDSHAYQMRIRVRLDLDALPIPIQLVSHIRREWRQSSGWEEWPVTQ